MTLSRFLAESAKVAPCGRTYPRLRDTVEPVEYRELASEDLPEKSETAELLENDRSSEGQDNLVGIGEADGEGEDARKAGEGM